MKTITAIEPQKKRKNRYNLYINNSFFMGVDEDTIIKYSLSVGMKAPDNLIKNIEKTEEYSKAFSSAVKRLSFRARSKNEIKKYLKQKGYSNDVIKVTIEKLIQYKYLDDVAFTKAFIKEKQYFNKYGKKRLKYELYYKGVDKEIANQLIEENAADEDEYKRALEVAQKKCSSFGSKENRNSKYKKLFSLLVRKGYSFDIISKVIKVVLNNSES